MSSLVFIVDDNAADRLLVRTAVEAAGIAVQFAEYSDSEPAIQALRNLEAPPSLIILDLRLICGEGFDVLKVIRATRGLTGVPVIVLTSSPDSRERQRAHILGATRFLKKPLDLDSFLQLVETAARELLGGGRRASP